MIKTIKTTEGKLAIALSGLVAIGLWFIVPFMIHLTHTVFHQIAKPSPTICVASHYNTVIVPIFISNGKTTTMMMVPSQVFVCDKEAPNPNYAQELAKWESSK